MSWLHIVLYQPEIPGNTGNIIRLCANTGACLHLIEPLGFALDDKRLRRAGLDYHEYAAVQTHSNWAALRETTSEVSDERIFIATRHASHSFYNARFQRGDMIVLGSETAGLPEDFRARFRNDRKLRLPMVENSRSLNLSNAAAVMCFEAARQCDFPAGMQ